MKKNFSKSATPDSMWATATKKNNKNMQSSHWITENFKSLVIVFCLIIMSGQAVFVQKAHAQEDTATAKVLFWVEDALGNRDSCWLYSMRAAAMATDGIDEHLGEANLYGVPPTKCIDIRSILRTDVNDSTTQIKYWLYTPYPANPGVPSFEENIDLKIDYRQYVGGGAFFPRFVLDIKAENYPITLYAEVWSKAFDTTYNLMMMLWNFDYWLHNRENGMLAETNNHNVKIGSLYKLTFPIINSENENYLYFFYFIGDIIGIKDTTLKISVFPNPSSDYIFIDCAELESEEISIFDVTGKFICSFIMSENPYMLDVSNFSNGLFFLINNDNHLLGKFIVEGK